MIRAVYENGVLHLLEPVPPDWSEGKEVLVAEAESPPSDVQSEDDNWLEEMDRLAAELDDPEMWKRVDQRLAEANRQAKEIVRRQMGFA